MNEDLEIFVREQTQKMQTEEIYAEQPQAEQPQTEQARAEQSHAAFDESQHMSGHQNSACSNWTKEIYPRHLQFQDKRQLKLLLAHSKPLFLVPRIIE